MKLTVEETGKAVLGAMVGMDFSWLNTVTMDMTEIIKDGKEAINADILLNDAPVGTMNICMDLANMTEYFQIPELSQNYMAIPLIPSMEETIADETGAMVRRGYRGISGLYGRISGFHGNLFKDCF